MSTTVPQMIALWEAWVAQDPARASAPDRREGFAVAHLDLRPIAEGVAQPLPPSDAWAGFVALSAWREEGKETPLRTWLRQQGESTIAPGFPQGASDRRPRDEHERQLRWQRARSRRRMGWLALLIGLGLIALFGGHHHLKEAPVFLAVGLLALPAAALLLWSTPRGDLFRPAPAERLAAWSSVPELAWVMRGPFWACPPLRGDRPLFEAYTQHVLRQGRLPTPTNPASPSDALTGSE